MIKTFEDYTIDISEVQKEKIVPRIITFMQNYCVGEENAITSEQLVKKIQDSGLAISDVTLRRCIKYIQFHNLCKWIVATQKGFFHTRDKVTVQRQIDSLIERENAIRQVRIHLQESLNEET